MTTLILPTEDAYAVAGPPQGHWTYVDWARLPDDGNRYEVIEGVLYGSSVPTVFHQWIVQGITRYVAVPTDDAKLGYAVLGPIVVQMPGCDPVPPDYVVVPQNNVNIIRGGRIRGVPDVIMEVLSPGSVAYEQGVKLEAYERAQVPEYAVIDPATRTLSHYRLSENHYDETQVFGENDIMTFAALPSISIPIAQLFAGAPDTTLRITDA